MGWSNGEGDIACIADRDELQKLGKGLKVKSFLNSYGIKLEDFDDVDWS